ncbi:hypothetical protein M655_025100 [Brevibacillus sp. NSP2.1]|uniref:hypothetical protein n=1 Tax=Brevibacillus sp. NSP2.1 TaxID=3003229 RepID=UPI00047E42C2|nr:hypothetical protein [Brevibacillus sp. NSP2.1]QHZ58648.1 hypothetical protein M655_025100 [Brevibacillus sp. NSP2.1]
MSRRDLRADLAICNATVPGPWSRTCNDFIVDAHGEMICEILADETVDTFIAESRTGWPHAIERALAAEAEVDRLSGNLRATFDALVGLLTLIPEKLEPEEQAIIDRIRADIYKEATAGDQTE